MVAPLCCESLTEIYPISLTSLISRSVQVDPLSLCSVIYPNREYPKNVPQAADSTDLTSFKDTPCFVADKYCYSA